jgi:hypothetical protein
MLLLGVTAALLVAGSAGSTAVARANKPTIIQRQGCRFIALDSLYGGNFDIVGLKPNTEYVLRYTLDGVGGFYFTTDDTGAYYAFGGGESIEPFEVDVRLWLDPNPNVDGDESLVEGHFAFTRPCTDFPEVPTAKSQCRNDGWRNFPATTYPHLASRFKSPGDCVRFVAHHQTRRAAAGLRE